MRDATTTKTSHAGRRDGAFTAVIPFYNEAEFIIATLDSLKSQIVKPARIILIDNGSTDRGPDLCRDYAENWSDMRIDIFKEATPGKIHALSSVLAYVETEYVAFCDADTYYPLHYLKRAREIFDRAGSTVAAVLATGVFAPTKSFKSKYSRMKAAIVGRLLAKQCHTGGFGQIFRVELLREAGGYDAARWPFVLEDHEIMHRVLKVGESRYDKDMWCRPSPRRADRTDVSWTAFEKLLYHVTPFTNRDWFFYGFLARRLARRGSTNVRLREQPWVKNDGAIAC